MTVRQVLPGDAGLRTPSYQSNAAAVPVAPSSLEWCFVYVVLVATALFPGLYDKYRFPPQAFTQVFWSVAYLIAGAQLLRTRAQILPLVRRHASLWLLTILMFVSTLWSVNAGTTMFDGIELIGTTLIGIYIATRFTLPEFLRVLTFAFVTLSALSVLIVFGNPGYGRADWGSGAWQGIYQEKNISGAMASLAIISQIVLLGITKGRGRWLVLASLLLSGLLLAEANSATAFADCAFVVTVTMATFACRSQRFGGFARFAAILGAVLAVVAVFVFGLSWENIIEALGRSSDLTSRANFWPYLQQAIADRPILGYGYDAFFQSSFGNDYLADFIVQAGGWTPYHAHDSFLQTLLDAGYVGLASLAVVLVISLWKAIRYVARERSIIGMWPLAIILFLTIGSYTETYYLNYNSVEWILFLAAIIYPGRSLADR